MTVNTSDLRLETNTRQILGMALPISLALLVPQVNFITNNIFLSGLGEQALACAGITGVYYLIFAVIGNGLNNGLQALIARRAGQNQHKEIGQLFFSWCMGRAGHCGTRDCYFLCSSPFYTSLNHS